MRYAKYDEYMSVGLPNMDQRFLQTLKTAVTKYLMCCFPPKLRNVCRVRCLVALPAVSQPTTSVMAEYTVSPITRMK